MIRKIGAALAITAGALAVTGVAAPAYAGPGNGTAETGEVVVWQNTGCSATAGGYWDFDNDEVYPTTVPSPPGTAPKFGTNTPIDPNVSGIVNYSTVNVRAYVNADFTGSYLQLLPYGQASGGLSYGYCSVGSLDNLLSAHHPAG